MNKFVILSLFVLGLFAAIPVFAASSCCRTEAPCCEQAQPCCK